MILIYAGSGGFVPIHWYIMTSPFTDDATRKFFENHKYFGLESDQVTFPHSSYLLSCWFLVFLFNLEYSLMQVTFFQQGTIPCVSKDGRFIMETPYRVVFFIFKQSYNITFGDRGYMLY